MEIAKTIFNFLVFPGFLFTATIGCLAGWVDRKVTARVQWRKGPPWWQNFADFIKLLGKETIIPSGCSRFTFLLSPIVGLSGVTLVSTITWLSLSSGKGFAGDLIVVIYLLMFPSLAVIMGGFASGNPLASLGASREIKLLLSYEVPFVLALLVPVIRSGGILSLNGLLEYQMKNGIFLNSTSGFIAFVVVLLCVQAKLGLVPFDMAEAETEIMAGPYIEYSGAPLAVFKLTKWMMLFVLPMFVIDLFMGGIVFKGIHILYGILKFSIILLTILIRNTNPRLRIDQAIKFFWGPCAILALFSILLAIKGY